MSLERDLDLLGENVFVRLSGSYMFFLHKKKLLMFMLGILKFLILRCVCVLSVLCCCSESGGFSFL